MNCRSMLYICLCWRCCNWKNKYVFEKCSTIFFLYFFHYYYYDAVLGCTSEGVNCVCIQIECDEIYFYPILHIPHIHRDRCLKMSTRKSFNFPIQLSKSIRIQMRKIRSTIQSLDRGVLCESIVIVVILAVFCELC
jgi:hypothetical protein